MSVGLGVPPARQPMPLVHAAATAALGIVAAGFAWVAAQAGMKGLLAGLAVVTAGCLLVAVRDRMNLLLLGLTLSLAVLLHKSFGPMWDTISSGPISIYLTTFDLVVVLLYGLWFLEGRMVRDLAAALQRPIVWVLLGGALLTSVSVLVAGEPVLAMAEIVRMFFSFALFLLLCARLRRRSEIWTLLAGLAVLVLVQFVVVVLQWRTGGVLGLDFLGVPTELGVRTLDGGQLGRPFGTIIHPVFLGAVVGAVGTFALGLALFLRTGWQRLVCLSLVPVTLAPMIIAHIRAATAAFAIMAIVMVVSAVLMGRLRARTVLAAAAVAAMVMLPLVPSFVGQFRNNFLTEHFWVEVDSRLELNQVGIEMFDDHPFVGVGLNNFEQEMAPYQRYGLIFADNPVHNLFLLQAAESGLLGLLGMGLVGAALAWLAWRTARRHPDPLCAGVAFGFLGVLGFFALEEQLGFSLRHDVPRNVFWLLAGMMAACANLDPGPERAFRAPRVALAALGRWLTAESPLHGPARNERRDRARVSAARQQASGHRASRGLPSVGRRRWGPQRWDGVSGNRRHPWSHRPLPSFRQPRFVAGATVIGVLVGLVGAGSAWSQMPDAEMQIVFSATDRATGEQGIYVAVDGGDPRKVSPDDGRDYSWPAWAFGGSHIVYTARKGPPGAPEQIYLMRADGTGEIQLTDTTWRNAQPKVSADGRRVVFTSMWGEFREVGLFSLDLATLEVSNVSARHRRQGAFDSDPLFRRDGGIVFAQSHDPSRGTIPTQIWTMDADGLNRRALTDDDWFNTDPAVSPDGQTVAIASFRGAGSPGRLTADNPFAVKLSDWMLVLRDIDTGAEEILNRGLPCFELPADEPCDPLDGPAYIPRFSADGEQVAFLTVRSSNRTSISVVDRRTTEATSVVDSTELAINWFDWIEPGPSSAFGEADIGTEVSDTRLLFGGDREGSPILEISARDRFGSISLPLAALAPTAATWSPDRERLALVSPVPFDMHDAEPTPPAPAGMRRREHFTLDWLARTLVPTVVDPQVAQEQIFVFDVADDKVRQVTTPWTEDWMDGVPEGDARGNIDPSFSPDGRYLLFTSVSSTSGESFLLRLDLLTEEVLSLTNVTAGAVPVADSSGRYSPDGKSIVFVSNVGDTNDVFLMDADGSNVRPVTNDEAIDLSPTWSPDGRSIVFTRFQGSGLPTLTDGSATQDAVAGRIPSTDWQLIAVDVASGAQKVLLSDRPAFRPVHSPDGDRIAFISLTEPGQPDIYVMDAEGGAARPLQATHLSHELFVDWR